ncbi:hypothetical protein LWC34_17290 [Kibdelosporangium philippinense]|uniref:Uncharacterized protein n=1 Tax=Kibdelosporangium philippinense TaxID=211113 RepID=A0ABS8Z9L9_9PSEU|nr:hypothetical protein [Kibdelosporangium philippinense]MCE7004568.1 hypothetical protein [Kibdelosporangium philippinense]
MTPTGLVRNARSTTPGHHPGEWQLRGKGTHMADLAYAVLLIGIFAVLALALRGLEKR